MRMPSRRMIAPAGAAAVALLTVGCSSNSAGMPQATAASTVTPTDFPKGSTMRHLAKQGTIKIGTKFDLPPIGAKNLRGGLEGFDIKIGTMIAGKLGIPPNKIQWVETVSANREPYIKQSKVDLVTAYYAITPERQKVVTFAGPYLKGGLDILVQKGNPKHITGPKAAAGKKICGQGGSTGPAVLKAKYPKVSVVEFDTMSKCIDALKQGSVDGVIQANHVLAGAIEKAPGKFELAGTLFHPTIFGIGMHKGDVQFCKFVEGVLKDAESDGSYAEAWKATIGKAFGKTKAPSLPKQMACK